MAKSSASAGANEHFARSAKAVLRLELAEQIEAFPPDQRTVVHFHFRDAPQAEQHCWLVVENHVADLCRDDPGHEVNVDVDSTILALTEVWAGDTNPGREIEAGSLIVLGAGRQGKLL